MKTFEQNICPANIITNIPSVGWICMVATINGNVTNEAPLNNGKLLTALSKTVAKCGHFSGGLIRLRMGLGWRIEIAVLPQGINLHLLYLQQRPQLPLHHALGLIIKNMANLHTLLQNWNLVHH